MVGMMYIEIQPRQNVKDIYKKIITDMSKYLNLCFKMKQKSNFLIIFYLGTHPFLILKMAHILFSKTYITLYTDNCLEDIQS